MKLWETIHPNVLTSVLPEKKFAARYGFTLNK